MRAKDKLADRLTALGYRSRVKRLGGWRLCDVQEYDIHVAERRDRMRMSDHIAWSARLYREDDPTAASDEPLGYVLASYDTVSRCARRGIVEYSLGEEPFANTRHRWVSRQG